MKSTPTPFLKLVARAYARNYSDMMDKCCFVFPNKRSATFFSRYLGEEMERKFIMPDMKTVSELVADFSTGLDATRYEQLFMLYNEYAKLSNEIGDFDRFLFWGDMLISDFNDVDRYMVNPDMLFTNVKRIKEINANYLTEEQLDAIKRYWGEEKSHQYLEQFWSHIPYNEGDNEDSSIINKKFIKLWEVLSPLYHNFRAKLREEGLCTSGMRYREAAETLKNVNPDNLSYNRYVFCGFNVLSTSEILIFSRLKAIGAADFYWDYNSPAFRLPNNRAGRFIERNIEEFPSLYDIKETPITEFPEIIITGVPSNVGQAKIAGQFISEMIDSGAIHDKTNAINTAVVLPDENLFIPMIHAIPHTEDNMADGNYITSLNVTMGFPMRLSPVATLIHSIVGLQLKLRRSHGELSFFHEDVKSLLTTPALYAIAPAECETVLDTISSKRMFMIPAEDMCRLAPSYATIFSPLGPKSSAEDIKEYIYKVLDLVSTVADTDSSMTKLQQQFIEVYKATADDVFHAARKWSIEMHDFTFFQLIDRMISGATINFKGEPLNGLQVMGMLETRSLDFENVVVLSMNERIFPKKQYTRSFIPEALRRAYGMATVDFQESIFAYYFYRLISRAKRVWLTYDARNVGGMRSSEISRYITQLLYLYPGAKPEHNIATFKGTTFDLPEISIQKTDAIMELLKRFTIPNSGYNMSPSALNTYIGCPLEFYLKYVRDYRVDNEVTDYMDSSTYGTIVHAVMQEIFENWRDSGHATVNREDLEKIVSPAGRHVIERILTRTINKFYNRVNPDAFDTKLKGEALVQGKVMLENIVSTLRAEMKYVPFRFLQAEKALNDPLEVSPSLSININLKIDRVDELGGNIRLIDYKTGDESLSAKSVEDLFDSSQENRAKGMMQVLFYCYLYHRQCGTERERIVPVIYKLREMSTKGIELLKIKQQPLLNYDMVAEEYEQRLTSLIEEIFNPEVPFTQAPTNNHCGYCEFKSICQR